MEHFAYREINERIFSNPHPWTEKVILLLGTFVKYAVFYILKQTQNGCHFPDDSFNAFSWMKMY